MNLRVYLSVILLAACLLAASPPKESPEEMLEAAIYQAKVLGDLPEAIRQFESIAGRFAGKTVAAQALLELGQAEQLLGHGAKARAAFRRILTDYPGQVSLVSDLLRNPELVPGATPRAQGVSWVSPPLSVAPSARCCMGMAYDQARHTSVLFGGFTPLVCYGDTWVWRNAWRQLSPATAPPPRTAPAMTYDGAGQNIVLFGGADAAGKCLNDTWTWDGKTWTRQLPPVSPPPRRLDGQSMAYHPGTHNIVLFGGADGAHLYGDTWTWNGLSKTWTQQHPASSPSARLTQIAYDEATRTLVLFGGHTGGAPRNSTYYNDTWIWDGTNWTKLAPPSAPSVRGMASMAYDPGLGAVVLFGGVGVPGGRFNETWVWNGAAWKQIQLAAAPATRFNMAMDYDPNAKGLLLFGGFHTNTLGDTWVLTRVP